MIIIAFKWHCIKCSSLVKGEYHKPIKEYVVVVVDGLERERIEIRHI